MICVITKPNTGKVPIAPQGKTPSSMFLTAPLPLCFIF